jgi:hypothetical protein
LEFDRWDKANVCGAFRQLIGTFRRRTQDGIKDVLLGALKDAPRKGDCIEVFDDGNFALRHMKFGVSHAEEYFT